MALLGHRYFPGASEGTSFSWLAVRDKWPSSSTMMKLLVQGLLICNVLPPIWSAPANDSRNFACPVFTDDKDDCQQEAVTMACATAHNFRLPDTYKCYCIHQVARPCASECMSGITLPCQEFCGEYLDKECSGNPPLSSTTGNPIKRSEEGTSTVTIIAVAVVAAVTVAGTVALTVYIKRTTVALIIDKLRQWLQSPRTAVPEELRGELETAPPGPDRSVEDHLLEPDNSPMTQHNQPPDQDNN